MRIVSPKRRLAQRLSSPDRLGTLPDPCPEEKRRIERQDRGATRPRPRDDRPDPQRGPARLPSGPPTGDRAPQRGTAPEDDAGAVARSRGKAGSAVESRSRGACALRPRSATSGSTSTCGREVGGTLHRHLRHRGKKRSARGQAGRGSRSRGHRRTSGGGEVAGRGLGGRHGSPSPGRRAVASGPRLQVHVAGPARRQDGRGNGRSDARAPGAVQGVRAHDHHGQRQGVRGPQGGWRGAGGIVLLRAAVSFLGARPERAHERAGSLPEGDRFSQPRRTAWRPCSTTGRARRWTTGLPRKFSSRGFERPTLPKRSPATPPPPGPRGSRRPGAQPEAAGQLRRGGGEPRRFVFRGRRTWTNDVPLR